MGLIVFFPFCFVCLLFCLFSLQFGELEAAISTVLQHVGVRTSQCHSMSMVFARFWCSFVSCWMVFCDQGPFRVCLGLFRFVLGFIQDWFRMVSGWFSSFNSWFCFLGLVWACLGLIQGWFRIYVGLV